MPHIAPAFLFHQVCSSAMVWYKLWLDWMHTLVKKVSTPSGAWGNWSFTRLLFCLPEIHIPQKKRVKKSLLQEIMHTVCSHINSDGARPQPIVWQYSFCWHGGRRPLFINSSQIRKKLEGAYPWNFAFVSVVLQMVERIELPTLQHNQELLSAWWRLLFQQDFWQKLWWRLLY